ncbi:hypothetical protein BHE90_012335 [Fusarium euwallaceae]|uniref:ATPase AAA-type core domain-containing protein n=1 Tax=Fusarium euwallaceae TaxID=1147111 RepID=A0A430LBY4_9HYPO|nr:hypothetical protein BHE90_012335 [Fusarium euwallaceae]
MAQGLPEINGWRLFNERHGQNETLPGTYYVQAADADVAVNQDEPEHRSAFWFNIGQGLNKHDIRRLTTLQLMSRSRNESLVNENEAGSGSWFEIAICGEDGQTAKKLPNGQTLSWLSHSNWFRNPNNGNEWCRGRMFTKDDEIFKHLKAGDVISVRVSASPGHRNQTDVGYLIFGFGDGPTMYRTPKFRQGDAPLISVHAKRRQECLMIPADDFSTVLKANIVPGGVDLMDRLLEPLDNDWAVQCHPLVPVNHAAAVSPNFDAAIEVIKSKEKDPTPQMEVVRQFEIKGPGQNQPNNPAQQPQGTPKIIVWDDSEVNKDVAAQDPNAKILIYQMHAPLWSSRLWDQALDHARRERDAVGSDLDRSTIVVIDADDLRADGIRISRGISWEKTMEDFNAKIDRIHEKMVENIDDNVQKKEVLSLVRKHVHLLVRCGYEGVLHLRPVQEDEQHQFVFHMVPNMAEGDLLRPYRGRMSGIHLAFVAGLAASLVRQPRAHLFRRARTQIGLAIELAIVWSHRFATTGFCKDDDGNLSYPEAKDINNYKTTKTKVIYGDQSKVDPNGRWSLFSLLEESRHSVAAEVVKLGTERVEVSIPSAKFGKVQTADRIEIEGYRSTAAVIHEYLNNKSKKPLSIAVFGQPGAGKSFGIKEVIKAVLKRDKEWEPIEANLSQFLQYSDLVRVFDKVRDTALNGETPVVLFDEFDSSFNGDLGWLKYFLAPMQDGEFMDSGFVRPIGPAIFIFIGGTSSSFREFKYGKPVADAEEVAADRGAIWKAAVDKRDALEAAGANVAAGADIAAANAAVEAARIQMAATKDNASGLLNQAIQNPDEVAAKAKKPDFISRLSAHINVKGPNTRGNHDKMFVMRRAMLLQGQLQKHYKTDVKNIQVHESVLNALLKHKEFPNGTRSIELILQSSRLSGRRRFEPSDLASDEQLSMHVGDVGDFFRLIDNSPIVLQRIRPVDIDLYNKIIWRARVD